MAHNKTKYAQLYKPDSINELVDSQKMFIDNPNQSEQNYLNIIRRISASVGSVAELRTIATSDGDVFVNGLLILVRGVGIYEFNSTSTDADNGTTIIKPTTGSGRWMSLTHDADTVDGKHASDFATANHEHIYQKAGGTGTAITLTNVLLIDGMSKTFVAIADNNGSATTINGKPLYKPNTVTPPKITSGKAVTVWYNATNDCFFIKASAEGDAIAENVLAGKTFSNDDDTGLVGTMPNNGPISAEIIDLVTENAEYIIPKGFHSGLRKIRAKISGLVASVIKAGTTVGGITGTFTSDANAAAGDILSGKTAYKNGSKITGTMPDRGTVNHELPINGSYTIPAGKHSGSGKVTQNIPTKGAQTYTPTTSDQTIPSGRYLTGNQIIKGDANLIPSKIPEDLILFGVQGTRALGKKFASGSITMTLMDGSATMTAWYSSGLGSTSFIYNAFRGYITNIGFIPSLVRVWIDDPLSPQSHTLEVLIHKNFGDGLVARVSKTSANSHGGGLNDSRINTSTGEVTVLLPARNSTGDRIAYWEAWE